jgi:hypothetical protein
MHRYIPGLDDVAFPRMCVWLSSEMKTAERIEVVNEIVVNSCKRDRSPRADPYNVADAPSR